MPHGFVRLQGEWSRAHRRAHAPAGAWMAAGFALGALCFASASVASQWASAPRPAVGVTFFVGSLFFTSAAYIQYWQAVNVAHSGAKPGARRRLRPASWEPHRVDWLASLVQLAGTLFFNISTFAAMNTELSSHEANLRVWAPDVFGSTCFLVAGELALAEVCGRWFCARGRSLAWRIVALNMVGSVAFGVSAATSVIQPSTGEPLSAAITNATTTLGAVCFFAGALLLIPEARQERTTA